MWQTGVRTEPRHRGAPCGKPANYKAGVGRRDALWLTAPEPNWEGNTMKKSRDTPSKVGRRQFLEISAGTSLAAATAAVSLSTPASAAISGRTNRPAALPAAKGPRCVVIGGGASGATMAKYLKKENPQFDVVMVEPNATYMSCFLSNLWLDDLIKLETLQHSFCDAATANNYIWLQGKLIDLDRQAKRAFTSEGYIDYHYIVLAPGIDYNYASIGIKDPAMEVACAQNFPAGFKPGSEHLSIKKKLANFETGIFLLTVPTGNYRCLPAPYERACMIANYFKKNKVKGKVALLDPGEKPFAPKAPGFLAAFSELYKDIIEYHPSTMIKSVDPIKQTVTTDFDTIKFTDAAIYPRVRAAKLIEDLGLHDPKSPQMEADIDVYKYFAKGDKTCFVTGDCRPMGFSKSGNTANSEAHYVAKVIAAFANGKDVDWTSPQTICYSMVNGTPEEAIVVKAKYARKGFGFTDVQLDNKRSASLGKAAHEWGAGLYRDMF
jgi:sulfide dehydrogenase [flavocytochrome c] flavoprotein subunit